MFQKTSMFLVSKNLDDILVWNKKVNEYIVEVFDFSHIFLAFDGVILLFLQDDLRVLKEVKSYLENYGFQIWMKWAMVNSLPLRNNEDPSLKVPSQSIKFYLYYYSSQLLV
jgi:hypothetical protein